MFLDLLKKYKEQYGIKLFSYVLLPDHLHLLLEMTGEGDQISGFMHDLNNSYTKYFNSQYERKGHLFEGRFKAAVIEKTPNLTKLTAYMHLNPKRLNLVANVKDYQNSSFGHYLIPSSAEVREFHLEQEISEVLSLLKDKGYAVFVNELTQEQSDKLHRNLKQGRILGSDEFIKRARQELLNAQARETARQDEPGKQKYRLAILTAGFLLIIVAGLGGIYFYFISRGAAIPEDIQQLPIEIVKKEELLNQTEWDIELVPISGDNKIIKDTLNFRNGKVSSTLLNAKGYSVSNFTLIQENDTTIWEVMQTSSSGTASWRGEVKQGKMRGILSLRSKEVPRSPERSEGSEVEGRQKDTQPQDFSFMSIKYRKKE